MGEQQIMDLVFKQGIFAVLFVWILFTTQKKNEARETKYQEVIEKNQQVIAEQAQAFTSMSKDVSEIKEIVVKGSMEGEK